MTRRQIFAAILTVLCIPLLRSVPAFALGDKVVPHVVDGGDAGLRYRTKFDITNLSPWLGTPITRVTVLFFRDNGAAWTIATNQGTNSSFTLNLGTSQTLRLETLGNGSFASGYAIIRNLETANSSYPDDFEVSLTVYFEVLQGTNVIDTVSVPVGQPTVSYTFPVEIDKSNADPTKWILTGFAIVNLTDAQNSVTMDLWETKTPLSGNASKYPQSATIVLSSAQVTKKTARFLDEAQFFPNITRFKGMAVATAQGPVAILALLQTPASIGVQYATLVPSYLDSLRRNSIVYLPQGYSFDGDLLITDYFRDEFSEPDPYYETPWDLLFETVGTAGTGRQLSPMNGATVAPIGVREWQDFDNISIEDLRNLTYSANSIDLGNASANLQEGFCFAIKTGLGRYVRARIRSLITYTQDPVQDLVLEVYAYR